MLLPWRVAKSSAPLDARPERKRLKRLDPRWRWFSVGGARQWWRHFGGHGVDERRTSARRAEDRNDTGTRLSPLVADRGLDLGGRAALAQHADVYVERTGSDLTGEHGRTGTQELSWVADFQAGRPQRQRCHYPALRDCDKVPAMIQLAVIAAATARFDYHIFLEAPHGTELARYGSPWASEIGIPARRADTALGGQRQAMHESPGQRQGDHQQQSHPQALGEKCPHAQDPFVVPREVVQRYPPCPGLTTLRAGQILRRSTLTQPTRQARRIEIGRSRSEGSAAELAATGTVAIPANAETCPRPPLNRVTMTGGEEPAGSKGFHVVGCSWRPRRTALARARAVSSPASLFPRRHPGLVILPAHDPGAASRLAQATGQAPRAATA